ncbi:hypothetical protein PAB09_02730 [Corynebacterium sp. SCR221107]|uniref:hypothetical protein n=1 Tax=Corynebacterium sp. SCR221107 TaxID=3017361 RepID=UPI0022EC5B91|nr:hypothetical protein [Corynebacterium sp. SCR221107]WBT09271.1 hypothetical protein PAB09_02730 [Corynebacterium sp. SCR221107]
MNQTNPTNMDLLADAGVEPQQATQIDQLIRAGHADETRVLLAKRRFELVAQSRTCHRQLLCLDELLGSLGT